MRGAGDAEHDVPEREKRGLLDHLVVLGRGGQIGCPSIMWDNRREGFERRVGPVGVGRGV